MKDYVKEFEEIIDDGSYEDSDVIHEAKRIIKEMQFQLSLKKMVLVDCDDNEAYGVLSVLDKTPHQVQEEINKIKSELESSWTTEGVIERLPKDWNVMYESTINGDMFYGTVRI